MPSDSLTYTDYMLLARWLTGRLEPRIGGQKPVSPATPPKYTPKKETILMEQLRKEREAVFCPEDMQLDEISQKLLWNTFYSSHREEGK